MAFFMGIYGVHGNGQHGLTNVLVATPAAGSVELSHFLVMITLHANEKAEALKIVVKYLSKHKNGPKVTSFDSTLSE